MSERDSPRLRAVRPARVGGRGAWLRAAEHVTFGILPLIVIGWIGAFVWAHDFNGPDFRLQYWLAAHHVLTGRSPYPPLGVAPGKFAFPYPAPAAFLFMPLALLPIAIASALFTAACIALPLLTLRVLRVGDWRLYGMVLLLEPVVAGWENANLSIPLTFGIAVAWRYRDVPWVAGLLAGALVSVKLFTWPILIWLIATRRWAATAVAVAFASIVNAIAWTVVGFDQIHRFVRVSELVTRQYERAGYGLVALFMHLGAASTIAGLGTVAVACAVALGCVAAGRARRDQTALLLALVLMLAASPLVWSHYFAVLLVPLALRRPRLAAVWLLQLPLWLGTVDDPTALECAIGVGVVAITAAILIREDRRDQVSWAAGRYVLRQL
jgi:alpha-1,2-mannosyltransferase